MERQTNVHAKVRQDTFLGDKQLSSTGDYWQHGAGNQRRTRWEMKTVIAGKRATLLQVFDSTRLWTDRNLPGRRDVEVVDFLRISQQLAAAEFQDAPVARQRQLTLLRGGLSALLAELLERFEFSDPQRVRVGDEQATAVLGEWKPAARSQLLGDDVQRLPRHIPHHVLLIVDQAYLFPRLVEYRRVDDASLATDEDGFTPAARPLSRFEFFAVETRASIDARQFRYSEPDHGVRDETRRVLDRIQDSGRLAGH